MVNSKKRVYSLFAGAIIAFLACALIFLVATDSQVAHAEEADVPIVVGTTYTFSDSGGEYSVHILSDKEYELHAENGGEAFDYKGSYTYIDGVLTLTAFDETLGTFYIQGSNLVKIVESDVTETVPPTFLSRLGEWISANKTEIVAVVSGLILLISTIVQAIKQKKKLSALGANLLTIGKSVSTTETSQGEVVNVTNELIKGYNKFEKALFTFEETENERYKTLLGAFAQTKAILEILMTVYANSKNIPQGVKDLVNLKYADVLKLVGDDDKLKAIAEPPADAEVESAEVDDESEG